MSKAIFIHPDQNLSPVATGGSEWVVQTGVVDSDPDYALTKLNDLDASTPCKCTTAGPFAVVRDLGSAKQVDLAIIPMHTLDAGGTVRFQMHSSSAWGAPDVDVTCVVPAWLQTSPALPVGLVFDLRGIAQATRTRRYVRVSCPANASTVLALGEIIFGQATELAININWGLRTPRQVMTGVIETPLGGRIGTFLGTVRRNIVGQIADTTDAGLLALQHLYDRAGNVVPFGFALDPEVIDGRFVYWNNAFDPTLTFLNASAIPLEFLEQSRGRAL